MKSVLIGAHLMRADIEPVAEAIPLRDLWLSAISVEDDQPLGDRELLVRVAGIRGRLLELATFVAIRYGFAAVNAADAESKCVPYVDRWRELLSRYRGNVEMTLKVAASSSVARPDRREFASGAGYLRALHAAAQAANIDGTFRVTAEDLLLPLAAKHRWIHRDERSVELALLIPRAHLEDVRSAAEELRRLSPHIPFLFSGPWPLEVFADDDHE